MNDKDKIKSMSGELRSVGVADLAEYLDKYADLIDVQKETFSGYMRSMFRKKGVSQADVFKKANLSRGYGYKLISGEKKTSQRDVILRICLVMGADIDETQKALKLSGFDPLEPDRTRDIILMVAVNDKVSSIDGVNRLLTEHGEEPLYEGMRSE